MFYAPPHPAKYRKGVKKTREVLSCLHVVSVQAHEKSHAGGGPPHVSGALLMGHIPPGSAPTRRAHPFCRAKKGGKSAKGIMWGHKAPSMSTLWDKRWWQLVPYIVSPAALTRGGKTPRRAAKPWPRRVSAAGGKRIKESPYQDMRLGRTPLPVAVAATAACAVRKRRGVSKWAHRAHFVSRGNEVPPRGDAVTPKVW